jgi:hypothetical protein
MIIFDGSSSQDSGDDLMSRLTSPRAAVVEPEGAPLRRTLSPQSYDKMLANPNLTGAQRAQLENMRSKRAAKENASQVPVWREGDEPAAARAGRQAESRRQIRRPKLEATAEGAAADCLPLINAALRGDLAELHALLAAGADQG